MANEKGDWEAAIPIAVLQHGEFYRLRVRWNGGEGDRLPAFARRVVQDEETKVFSAQVWSPEAEFNWRHKPVALDGRPLTIYETHVGIAQEEGKVGSYLEFAEHVVPRIANGVENY